MASILLAGISGGSASLTGSLTLDNYLNLEASTQDGEPVELYLLNEADTNYWSYTSSNQIIVYSNRSYAPISIKRGRIRLDTNSLKTNLELEVPITNTFVRQFIPQAIENEISITIYRRHSSYYITYWKGFVRGIKFKSNVAVIICGLKTTSLKRFGLMRKYQRNCGVPLFSPLCTISDTDPTYYVDGTINSVNGTTIDATIFSSKTDGWFLGGKFKSDDGVVYQKIVYHSGTEIKISKGHSSLAAGDTFRAWAGCDNLKATCKTKFNNKLNFAGQPYIPDKNPFTGDPVM